MTDLLKPVSSAGVASVGPAEQDPAPASVRELLTELAALEDATRTIGGTRRQRQAALARQQEIIDELHRRCPEASRPS